MEKELNWAVLGTGVIANEMAKAMESAGRRFYAVGNRTYERAVEFAEKYCIETVYEDFRQMFSDENVDIIYITTPHHTHIEFLEEALAHGKHVLCEKSITLNSMELERAVAMAKENQVILAEAMTIYHMPVYKKIKAILKEGSLGAVQMMQLNFGSFKEYDMTNRFFNKDLAGGALLDIGVYAISLARFFMSGKPDEILSQVKYAPSGVDEQSGILLTNKTGEMAVISLTLHAKQPKRCVIACENGYVEILEYPRADKADIVWTESGQRETFYEGKQREALLYEMEDMENAVRLRDDSMLLQNTRDVMEIMTKIRKDWGLYYDSEDATIG